MTVDRPAARAAWHEAFTLPLVFLSVVLLGGLRIDPAGGLAFVPPRLMALVLAVVLLAALHRSGALAPALLVAPHRTGLENASGFVVIASLGLAAAQAINMLTPEAGLLALVFDVAWLVLFGNNLAARPDRPRLLSSLLVIFGAAFVVKFVLLGALYDPNPSLTKRVVMALVEGVTLGGLAAAPPGAATGYVAFASLLLFFAGLAALPHALDLGDVTRGPVVSGELMPEPSSSGPPIVKVPMGPLEPD